jgi:uncharacterized protein (DUF305 family)
MTPIRVRPWRFASVAVVLLIATVLLQSGIARADEHGEATSVTPWSCDLATPAASPEGMGDMDMGTPMAEDGMDMEMGDVEFDQLYIDMMIPHHASIIALSETALPHLTDERLIAIATNIVENQGTEITELQRYRQQFYGDPEPMAMDEHMLGMMMEAMPSMGSGTRAMMEMGFQMDAQAQVNAFCAGEDPDLTFIDLVIPHHEMAIASSQDALEHAVHDEITAFAQRVIEDQQAEIDELKSIRAELTS